MLHEFRAELIPQALQ